MQANRKQPYKRKHAHLEWLRLQHLECSQECESQAGPKLERGHLSLLPLVFSLWRHLPELHFLPSLIHDQKFSYLTYFLSGTPIGPILLRLRFYQKLATIPILYTIHLTWSKILLRLAKKLYYFLLFDGKII